MAMSGFSFAGSDIGGFAEQPHGELFARWIQLGVFHPFCRVHSSGDHGDQEPWAFDEEVTDIVRKFIEIQISIITIFIYCFLEICRSWNTNFKIISACSIKKMFIHIIELMNLFLVNKYLVCPIIRT